MTRLAKGTLISFTIAASIALGIFIGLLISLKVEPTYNKADVNRDGKVNLTDFSIFMYYYHADPPIENPELMQ